VGDLLDLAPQVIRHSLGTHGSVLLASLDGSSEVQVRKEAMSKTVGAEETFPYDLFRPDEIDRELVKLVDTLSFRLFQRSTFTRAVVLKIRTSDFQSHLRQETFRSPTRSPHRLLASVRSLVDPDLLASGVRLVGVSATRLADTEGVQSTLHEVEDDERVRLLEETIGRLKLRFGEDVIAPARLIKGGSIVVRSEGERRWGPSSEDGDNPSDGR
jgi:DNA polymerase-4